jgi:hypothetical protein
MFQLSNAFWLQVLLAIFIFLPTATPFPFAHNLVRDVTVVHTYYPSSASVSWFQQRHVGRSLALPMVNDDSDESVQEFGSHQRDPMWQERAKRWIIIVDDEAPIRHAVGELLFDRGYQVTACADGPTALKVVQDGVDQPAAFLPEEAPHLRHMIVQEDPHLAPAVLQKNPAQDLLHYPVPPS